MANIEHREIAPAQRHAPQSWVVADETARLALVVVADDVGKYCLQQDDNTQWMLVDDSPVTWDAIGGGTITAADITDSTTVGRAVLTAADEAAARTALGAGTSDFSGDYADLSGAPTFGTAAALNVPATGDASAGEVVLGDDTRLTDAREPTTHTHPLSDLEQSGATTGQVPSWDGTEWIPSTPVSGGLTNPMTTAGDLIVGGGGGTPERLAAGADGKVMMIEGGAPGWVDPPPVALSNIDDGGADTGQVLTWDGSAWTPSRVVQAIPVACSDEATAITVGAAKVTFRMPFAFHISGIRISLTTAQASGTIFTVDVNEAGVSILSTKLTIDNTEKSSTTAVAAPVLSDTELADDSEITVDVDQIGNGTARGLKLYIIGWPT